MERCFTVQGVAGLGPGEHLCCLFASEEEERSLLAAYLRHGMEAGGKALFVTDRCGPDEVPEWLEAGGLEAGEALARGCLCLAEAETVYFENGTYDPAVVEAFLRAETDRAREEGYAGLYVAVEMSWALRGVTGPERLAGYEAEVNRFLEENPATAVCLYDRRLFSRELLTEILSAHPRVATGDGAFDDLLLPGGGPPAGDEASMRTLLEAMQESAMLLGPDGRVEFANRAAAARLGRTPEEMGGRRIYDFLPPGPAAVHRSRMDEVLRSGRPGVFEDERDGLVFENTLCPVVDGEVRVAGVAAFSRDVGEQLREKEALRANEERARRCMDLAGVILLVLDTEGRVALVNRKGSEVLGLPEEEILGKDWFEDFLPERVRGPVEEVFRSVLKGEREAPERYENPVLDSSGEERLIAWRIVILPGLQGVGTAILSAGEDVTELRGAQAALRESEERYRLLTENVGMSIGLWDPEGRLLHFNRKALEHMGSDRPERFLGRTCRELFGKEQGAVMEARFKEALLSGKCRDYEDLVDLPTGRKWLLSNYARTVGEGGEVTGVLVISSEITGLRRAEEKSRRLAAIVRRSAELVNLADMEGRMVFLNEAGGRMLGLDPGRLEGTHILDAIPEHLRELVRREVIPALQAGGAWEGELQYRNAVTGELVDVQASAFAISDPANGKVMYYANVSRDVTEAKRVGRALEESEERLRRVTDNMLDMVGEADSAGVLSYVSPSCQRILGYRPEEMLGHSIFESVHPEDRERLVGAFAEILKGPRAEPVLSRHRNAEGRYVWLEANGRPVFDTGGATAGIILSAREVTERVESQRKLERSWALVTAVFETLPATICLQAPDYTIRYANREFREAYGDPEGRMCYEILHGRLGPCEDCIPLRVHESGRGGAREIVDVNGRHFNVHYVPLTDEDGESLVLEMGIEISERVRTMERLKRLNRCFLELGTDPSANMEMIVDAGREALDATLLKYCGLGRGLRCMSAAGTLATEPLTPSVASCPVKAGGRCQGPLPMDDLSCLPGEELASFPAWYGLSYCLAVPVNAGGRQVGSLCLFSVEGEKPGEEEEELMSMLARALGIEEERYHYQESLRDFIDVASHELRHPITIMKGYAGILRNRNESIDDVTREIMLDIIDHGADRLNRLVGGLLDISRIERGRFEAHREEQPLLPLVALALTEMRQRGFSNDFRLEVSGEPGLLELDGEKIVQLMVILLENAVKYSPSGKPVTVSIEGGREPLMVSVEDCGIGVEEEDAQRIFERFFQVEEVLHHSTPGMGMGLYIAREIVGAHGGRIWHEPRGGGGSAFRFELPRHA